jgi:hypothetical protein
MQYKAGRSVLRALAGLALGLAFWTLSPLEHVSMPSPPTDSGGRRCGAVL